MLPLILFWVSTLKKKELYLLFLIVFLGTNGFHTFNGIIVDKSIAEEAMQWTQTYGGSREDGAHAVIQMADGEFVLIGFTWSYGAGGGDAYLVKTNARGELRWNRTYGGASDDRPYSGIQTTDGGFAIAGYTKSSGAGWEDFWLIKIDKSGELQWSRTYGGSSRDIAYSVIQSTDGGFVLAGTHSFKDFWLVKTDAYGMLQWNRTYGGSGNDQANSVIQTTDGGFVLVGETHSPEYGATAVKGATWLLKTDGNGFVEWNRTYGGSEGNEASSIIQTTDGGFTFAGRKEWDAWLVKTDANGDIQWEQTFGDDELGDAANSVIQTTDGGFALAGYTSHGLLVGKEEKADFFLVKTDASGIFQWNQTYGGSETEWAYSVIETADGGFTLTGFTSSYGAGSRDVWLVKTNAKGIASPSDIPGMTLISSLIALLTLQFRRKRK